MPSLRVPVLYRYVVGYFLNRGVCLLVLKKRLLHSSGVNANTNTNTNTNTNININININTGARNGVC